MDRVKDIEKWSRMIRRMWINYTQSWWIGEDRYCIPVGGITVTCNTSHNFFSLHKPHLSPTFSRPMMTFFRTLFKTIFNTITIMAV